MKAGVDQPAARRAGKWFGAVHEAFTDAPQAASRLAFLAEFTN